MEYMLEKNIGCIKTTHLETMIDRKTKKGHNGRGYLCDGGIVKG
jgi:hypothetical protein